MKGKFYSIIAFTLSSSVAIAVAVASLAVDRRISTSVPSQITTSVTDSANDSGNATGPAETTAVGGHSNLGSIYEEILSQFKKYETVFSPNNVGGFNHNRGGLTF